MSNKFLTLVATGIAGLVLGAGIGVAAAGDGSDSTPPTTSTPRSSASMDEMHGAMRDQMPDDLAAQCDEMHASMPAGMRSMSPESMDSMMGEGMRGTGIPDQHAQHHR